MSLILEHIQLLNHFYTELKFWNSMILKKKKTILFLYYSNYTTLNDNIFIKHLDFSNIKLLIKIEVFKTNKPSGNIIFVTIKKFILTKSLKVCLKSIMSLKVQEIKNFFNEFSRKLKI